VSESPHNSAAVHTTWYRAVDCSLQCKIPRRPGLRGPQNCANLPQFCTSPCLDKFYADRPAPFGGHGDQAWLATLHATSWVQQLQPPIACCRRQLQHLLHQPSPYCWRADSQALPLHPPAAAANACYAVVSKEAPCTTCAPACGRHLGTAPSSKQLADVNLSPLSPMSPQAAADALQWATAALPAGPQTTAAHATGRCAAANAPHCQHTTIHS
jgi:hypothetical protein